MEITLESCGYLVDCRVESERAAAQGSQAGQQDGRAATKQEGLAITKTIY